MNTYKKYAPNVFVAKCTEPHEKGEIIIVETRHGKENESVVFNLVAQDAEYYYYSIVRADGFNSKEWARRKAEKLQGAAINAEKKSDNYYKTSNKDRDFLSLGEPVKVGHHSENRHRRIIDQAHNNMGKCIEFSDKAKEYQSRAAYWASRANDINLSMPESIEYFEFKLEGAITEHEGLKNGTIPRRHSYSLTYAKKNRNEIEKKLALAKRLWG